MFVHRSFCVLVFGVITYIILSVWKTAGLRLERLQNLQCLTKNCFKTHVFTLDTSSLYQWRTDKSSLGLELWMLEGFESLTRILVTIFFSENTTNTLYGNNEYSYTLLVASFSFHEFVLLSLLNSAFTPLVLFCWNNIKHA